MSAEQELVDQGLILLNLSVYRRWADEMEQERIAEADAKQSIAETHRDR